MAELQEIQLDDKENIEESPPEPQGLEREETGAKAVVPKAKGRPVGVKDRVPRPKRKPPTKPVVEEESEEEEPVRKKAKPTTRLAKPSIEESSSDSERDAAAMRRVMRSLHREEQNRVDRKRVLYSSWFGR